jgi:hypothetical protein
MMSNLVKKLYRGIAHYAFGCVCYNYMGMLPKERDAFVLSLLDTAPAAESDKVPAEKRANPIDPPPGRARRTRTA